MARSALLRGMGFAAAAVALAGCNESAYKDYSAKANKSLPPKMLAEMKAKGMERSSPIMARIFKEEGKVEIWKQKTNGRYDVIATYDICKWSGKLGPKYIEGDRQAPEGFYTVRPSQMNPNSSYHLAFNIGYPNAYDRAWGRTGANLMVHGACSSQGCYSMTDAQIEEIYAFGRDAFQGGQTEFQIEAFPFRMTAANMARYKDDPNYPFWQNLKEGYDNFEIAKVPPKVDVCGKRYVFNATPEDPNATFSATAACPAFSQPDSMKSAYQSYQKTYDVAFNAALDKGAALPPKPTLAGLKEAKIVADWTKRRDRGERIPLEPPVLAADGSVRQTTDRMGRIDSAVGRKMAVLDAEKAQKEKEAAEKAEAKKRAEEEKAAAKAMAAAAKAEAKNKKKAAPDAQAATDAAYPAPADAATAAPEPAADQQPSLLGRVTKRFSNIFGS